MHPHPPKQPDLTGSPADMPAGLLAALATQP